MITLHSATEGTKTVAKWGAIAFIAVIVVMIIFNLGVALKEMFFPTPKAPPTVEFGKLPSIEFSESATNKSLVFSLNTLTGTLPTLPDRLEVYKLLTPEPNLLAQKRIQERVSRVGFRLSGVPVSETLYRWEDSDSPSRKLLFDVLVSNFSLSSSYLSDENVSKTTPPSDEDAKKTAQSFLEALESYPKDIDSDKIKTTLYSIKNSLLIPATSLSTAQITRVDFFQKDINKIPIFYPHSPFSTMNLFISGGSKNQVVSADFFHQNISSSSATYPLKTSSEAFTALKRGEAHIANHNGNDDNVQIKNVYLGYYLGDKKQDYLMPIVVFEGENGFFGYVSATKDDWINTTTP